MQTVAPPPDQETPGAGRRLSGRIVPVGGLTAAEREGMYRVLESSFANVTPARFRADLAEKEWVILLADAASGAVAGFSTIMRLREVVEGRAVLAFFSGDTVISPRFWGETVLPRLWAQHVFRLAAGAAEAEVYWFLISSGYKTYRFLSVFFREFFPTYRGPTPPRIKGVLDALGRRKFPTEYDPRRGVVRFAQATPLRRGIAEVSAARLADPHVAYFLAANPGHAAGDELACLAELRPTNLTAAGRRMLRSSEFRVPSSEFRVRRSQFRVPSSEFRVDG